MSTAPERAGRTRRRSTGQVMVLGCVTLLTMALMLMLSFNLTNAINEKIRLQSHSDAMAYSVAVVEARSFNYFAYTNRAEAAAYVTMCTLHAYMAGISLIPAILTAAEYSFFEIAAEEFAQCCECQPFCCAVIHCFHGIEAIMIALQYMDKSDEMANKVEGLDDEFNQGVQMMEMMVNLIHVDQLLGVIMTATKYSKGDSLSPLHDMNAQFAKPLNSAVGVLNMREYACGMEGSPLDTLCQGPGSRPASSQTNRARVMADVANSSRPGFDRSGPPGIPLHLYFDWGMPNGQGYMNIQNDGMAIPIMSGWDTGVVESTCDVEQLNKGTQICSSQSGFFIAQWQDGFGGMTFSAQVGSDKNGDVEHEPSSAHGPTHDKFTGIQSEDGMSCMMQGDCFINFRSSDSADEDYGQPSAYGHIEQELRVQVDTDAQNPWELNSSHTMNWNDGARGVGSLNLGPRKIGKAVSKAKVYFHRYDDWKFPPTMFDPYWRAKLHPFKRNEMVEVLGAAGDTDGAEIVGAGAVEGDLNGDSQ